MGLVAIALCGLVVVELLVRLPVVSSVHKITLMAGKAGRTVSSKKISDHWKERILPVYALHIGLGSIKAFGWLLLAFSPFLLLWIVWPGSGENSLIVRLLDWRLILGLTVLCGGYAWARRRAGKAPSKTAGGSSAYSPLDRILHRLALGVPLLSEMVHDIERAVHLKSAPDIAGQPHVFVSGLARSGSTVLLRELYRTGQFGALTYVDMPFVLAPNLWRRLGSPADPGVLRERAHGDGIKINAESPEAFDEVFWRVQNGSAYIRQDRLLPHYPDRDLLNGFTDYMRLVLKCHSKTRYLSKNNNNILRLDALSTAYPAAYFLIPLRDPLQHAYSLLRQHRRFLQCDDFTADYMGWLGHHEFGRTHRPFAFDSLPEGDPKTLDYWLRVWIAAYQHIAGLTAANILLIDLEQLAINPKSRATLAERLELPVFDMKEMRPIPPSEVGQCDPFLTARAQEVFFVLQLRAASGSEKSV